MKMDGDDYGKYFRVLELPQDASLMEVRSAYLQLKEELESFDRYLWQFVEGRTIQNRWTSLKEKGLGFG